MFQLLKDGTVPGTSSGEGIGNQGVTYSLRSTLPVNLGGQGDLTCYHATGPRAANLPGTTASGVPRPHPPLPDLLPGRAGHRSERRFRGHAGGVLSSRPGLVAQTKPTC